MPVRGCYELVEADALGDGVPLLVLPVLEESVSLGVVASALGVVALSPGVTGSSPGVTGSSPGVASSTY